MKENILKNMLWRGSKKVEELPFNEVDYLILSVLIYQRLEDVPSFGEGLTIEELYPLVCPLPLSLVKGFDINRYKLWALCSSSKRFKSLRLDHFSISLSKEKNNEKQFAAAIFSFSKEEGYVVYRGTDESITGWKEDLNLGFEDEIPSENMALKFLERFQKEYNTLILTGHSKGGTLALYSLLKCSDETLNKTNRLYLYDSPGLPDSLSVGPRWEEIKKKTESFVPSDSLIGMLFNGPIEPLIVKSDSIGIMQHDAFNWHIRKESFVLLKELSIRSKLQREALQKFFHSSTKEDREVLVEVLYKVLSSLNEDNVFRLPLVALERFSLLSNEINKLSDKEKNVVKRLSVVMREATRSSLNLIVGKEEDNKIGKDKKETLS